MRVISKALEVYYRLRSGQISMALDHAYRYPFPWEFTEGIQKLIRLHTHPELSSSSSYGFNSDKIDDARIAYEINKTFEEFLSVTNNDGFYGHGTNFHGPLKASEEPLPEVVGFIKYKEYPLPDAKSNSKAFNLYQKEKYKELWQFIDSLNLDLPKAEMKEVIPVENGVVIRVHKPRRKDENE